MKDQHKLAAIMFTDIVGYSALMSKNEKLAMSILDNNRNLHKSSIAKFNGEYIKEIGDGTLSIFPSAWDAVSCALDLQHTVMSGAGYRLRIGIHIGDVITEENDVFGDAVNIAARIQGVCDPGKVCISARILEDVKNKLETGITYIGEKSLKNIDHPVEIYALSPSEKKLITDESRTKSRKKAHFIYSKNIRANRIIKLLLSLLSGLLLAAIVVLFFRPNLLGAFTGTGSTPIAVISFENQTGDTAFNYLQKAIPNLLITNLEQSRLFQVITWERMKDVIAQLGKKNVEIIDTDLGLAVCQKEGCHIIVTGSFVRAGDVFVTDVKVLDVASKQILKSVSSRGSGIGSILETQIDELSKAIARSAGTSFLAVKTAPMHIRDVTTSSMEAYRYYMKGLDSYDNANWEDARQFFEQATQNDPDFAMAYLYLWSSYMVLQNQTKGNEAIEKAYHASEKATKNEQILIKAYYAANIDHDQPKLIDLLKVLAEKKPRDKRIHYTLATAYSSNNRQDDALEELLKAVELDPEYGAALNALAYTYFFHKGDVYKAMEYLLRYASLNPNDANPFDTMGDLYFEIGKLDDAIEKYKQALKIKPGFFCTTEKISYCYALKEDYPQMNLWMDKTLEDVQAESMKTALYYSIAFMDYLYGKLAQAIQSLDLSAESGNRLKQSHTKSRSDYLKAFIYYDLGQYEEAERYILAYLNKALATDTTYATIYYENYNFLSGLIHIRKYQMDSASANIQQIGTYSADSAREFRYHFLRKEFQIASAQEFQDLDTIGPDTAGSHPIFEFPAFLGIYNLPFQRNSLAEAYRRFGMLDKAVKEYERLITFNPDSKDRRLVNPRYHYYLGILYQEKGMNENAIEQLRRFLDLWQDADPIFKEPDDARKRLKRLTMTE